jgi:hypothetical protein
MGKETQLFQAFLLYKEADYMDYTRKICPICREEFFVLSEAKEKAVYCNLKCLLESADRMNKIDLIEPLNLIKPF